MPLIDISPPISPELDVWPGDQRFEMVKSSDISKGDHMDVGAITTSLHMGSHIDAHRHFAPAGADTASMPLEHYYGPCQVIDVDTGRGQRFGLKDLRQEPVAERLLFKTGTFPDPRHWNEDFAAPEPALIDALADRGVKLIGFDSPSTDLFDDADMVSHKRLAARGMANLEGVVLSHVDAGHYTLCAFPLRIVDGDGSPVRAVLVT